MDETQAQEQFEREKKAYFAIRDQLLKTHFGKWVAIVDGKIVAVGDQMSKVAAEAFQKNRQSGHVCDMRRQRRHDLESSLLLGTSWSAIS